MAPVRPTRLALARLGGIGLRALHEAGYRDPPLGGSEVALGDRLRERLRDLLDPTSLPHREGYRPILGRPEARLLGRCEHGPAWYPPPGTRCGTSVRIPPTRGQYAPRRRRTTGIVFSTMNRSYASDQFSM